MFAKAYMGGQSYPPHPTPAAEIGCPISRSFFARCGIPRTSSAHPQRLNSPGGNRTVPHVRPGVHGPRKLGAALQSLSASPLTDDLKPLRRASLRSLARAPALLQILAQQNRLGDLVHGDSSLAALLLHRAVSFIFANPQVPLQNSLSTLHCFARFKPAR